VFEFIPYQEDAKYIMRGSSLQQARGFYYFITAISKTNNESKPVMVLNASATTTKK
jgi:hypothetical protein